MTRIQDVIDTLTKSDCIYSVEYWTEGNEKLLKSYAEDDDIYYYGMAYCSKDKTIRIYRFQTGYEDLEEWLVIGLTQKEINYISNEITRKLLKEVK